MARSASWFRLLVVPRWKSPSSIPAARVDGCGGTRAVLVALSLAATSLVAPDARAAGFFDCSTGTRVEGIRNPVRWSNRSPVFEVHQNSFPQGSARLRALNDGFRVWNDSPQNLQWAGRQLVSRSADVDDNRNGIAFVSQSNTFQIVCGSNASACAVTEYTCSAGITEVDIFFSPDELYTTSTRKIDHVAYGGGFTELGGVVIHELGHALGLAHTANTYNVMGDTRRHYHSNGSTATAYVGEDAANGAVRLYGTRSGAREDVSVTHWRRCGSQNVPGDDPVAIHCYVRMFDTSGNVLRNFGRFRSSTCRDSNTNRANPGACQDERVYDVRVGQTIELELGLENNGRSQQPDVITGYFFSTNDTISTGDLRFFRTDDWNLGRNTVFYPSPRIQLTIPPRDSAGNPLNSGQIYFIGAIVDVDSRISEFDEGNNATYVPVRILP